MRRMNRSPLQVASIAQTLLSTSPEARPMPRTRSSVKSVATPDAFFGHAIQSPPPTANLRTSAAN